MATNLFLSLRKQVATQGLDPREDYLTEAFAWLLQNEPGLGLTYARWLATRAGWPLPEVTPTWQTQVYLPGEGERGFVDLVGLCSTNTLLVEHKRWAPLSSGQLQKYRRLGEQRWPGRFKVVLVTASRRQHEQDPDFALTWAEVVNFLRSRKNEPVGIDMVQQFVDFLDTDGLGPLPLVTREAIAGYLTGRTLEPSLTALFERLPGVLDLEALRPLYRALGLSDTLKAPFVYGTRWGRLGLDFPSWRAWRPGVFVGVMLDGRDHLVGLSKPELGPDFSLVVDVHLHPGQPTWEEIVRHPEFAALRDRLAAGSGDYEFVDHLAMQPVNRWHPIHLRRPLAEVLRGVSGTEEQFSAVEAEIGNVIGVLTVGGELERMTGAFLRDEKHGYAGRHDRP
ncbi:MAG: hypothetical protein ABIO70_28350 [Pseudomonadota bacterium]